MGYREGTWTPTKRRGPIAAEFSGPGPAAVTLPSLFGTTQRDPSKSKAPAFTFRPRINGKIELPGPGPGKYLTAGVTRKGRESPAAPTLSGRLKEEKPFNTPAPNAYHSEKGDDTVHDKAPLFSFGVKIKDPKLADIPAVNKFYDAKWRPLSAGAATTSKHMMLKEGHTQDCPCYDRWLRHKETRERVMKERDTMPGPGAYTIKDDFQRVRTPCWNCVGRKDPKIHLRGPAPNAYNVSGLVHKGGTPHALAAHMFGKAKDFTAKRISDTPVPKNCLFCPSRSKSRNAIKSEAAPNAYKAEKSLAVAYESSPKFTFGEKPKAGKVFNTPAPNAYNRDKSDGNVHESAPLYSFAPNSYNPEKSDQVVHEKSYNYSFGIKLLDAKPNNVPGEHNLTYLIFAGAVLKHIFITNCGCCILAPNSYNPEKSDQVVHEKSYNYSFGIKLPDAKPNNVPAPNSYNPEKSDQVVHEKSYNYSFGIKLPDAKPNNVPAPNSYNPEKSDQVVHEKTQNYSFGIKLPDAKPNNVPAPNAYNRDENFHESAPLYSFGAKIKDPSPFNVPAPNSYNPEKSDQVVHEKSHNYSFGIKLPDAKPNNVPAPNAYSPDKSDGEVHESAPVYSFGAKIKDPNPFNVPAPNSYNPEKSDQVVHEKSYNYSFGIKLPDAKPNNVPAPNSYNPEKSDQSVHHRKAPNAYKPEKGDDSVHKSAPDFSFGMKVKDPEAFNTPSPNSYTVPTLLGESPSYTLSGKGKDAKPNQMPAPNAYAVPEASAYKLKSPSFSLGEKTELASDKTQKPGPGAHYPEKS
uniref:Uncharacterized protein n=1 Tax=Strigamia maritima TaxID=126957 RepID=T1IQ09_STRMM